MCDIYWTTCERRRPSTLCCIVELRQRLISNPVDSVQSTPLYNSLTVLDPVLEPPADTSSSTLGRDMSCEFEVNVVDDGQ